MIKAYVLHGLIYSFLSIWDFKNKWGMCWTFHFIQEKLASSLKKTSIGLYSANMMQSSVLVDNIKQIYVRLHVAPQR